MIVEISVINQELLFITLNGERNVIKDKFTYKQGKVDFVFRQNFGARGIGFNDVDFTRLLILEANNNKFYFTPDLFDDGEEVSEKIKGLSFTPEKNNIHV